MDSCVTGQYDNLSVEAFMFCPRILNVATHDKDWACKVFGFVPKFWKEKTLAQEYIEDPQHIDKDEYLSVSDNDCEDGTETICQQTTIDSDEEEIAIASQATEQEQETMLMDRQQQVRWWRQKETESEDCKRSQARNTSAVLNARTFGSSQIRLD